MQVLTFPNPAHAGGVLSALHLAARVLQLSLFCPSPSPPPLLSTVDLLSPRIYHFCSRQELAAIHKPSRNLIHAQPALNALTSLASVSLLARYPNLASLCFQSLPHSSIFQISLISFFFFHLRTLVQKTGGTPLKNGPAMHRFAGWPVKQFRVLHHLLLKGCGF